MLRDCLYLTLAFGENKKVHRQGQGFFPCRFDVSRFHSNYANIEIEVIRNHWANLIDSPEKMKALQVRCLEGDSNKAFRTGLLLSANRQVCHRFESVFNYFNPMQLNGDYVRISFEEFRGKVFKNVLFDEFACMNFLALPNTTMEFVLELDK